MRNKVILRSTDVHLLAAESRGGWLLGRVLVTGIAGFIGSHLGQALVRAGFAVRGVDAFTDTYAVEQKRDNAALLTSIRSLELITADLAQIGSGDLYDLLADVEAVVHLAGQPGVPDSWGAPFQLYVERNVTATQRLLDASAARRVDRFVYASSSSVYGPSTGAGRRVVAGPTVESLRRDQARGRVSGRRLRPGAGPVDGCATLLLGLRAPAAPGHGGAPVHRGDCSTTGRSSSTVTGGRRGTSPMSTMWPPPPPPPATADLPRHRC